jgi:hypothetical protein
MKDKKNILINNLSKQLIDIQKNKLWMGDNFEKKLNKLSSEDAFVRPLKKLNSVAQIIAHLTFLESGFNHKTQHRQGRIFRV